MIRTLATVCVVLLSAHMTNAVKVKDVLSMNAAQVVNPLPPGPYSASCDTCTLVNNVLTCTCGTGDGGEQQTSIQNPWACEDCLNNIQGNLVCPLPSGSNFSPYTASCSGCGISFGSLYCTSCNGQTNIAPLANACTCTGVQFISGLGLVCVDNTPAPSTASPTFPTVSPTSPSVTLAPNNVPPPAPVCGGWWTQFATEAAPYKGCSQFTQQQGCTHQNWCCWQATSSTSGVCAVPNGVPVDCTTVSSQAACISQGQGFCFWNASYGPSGMCQRVCPGNPSTMCVF